MLFALSICGDPELLYLDEPTTGLDVEARRGLWQQIRTFVERGRSVVLTTHYLEEADALADRIVLLNEGRSIAEGSPSMIKARVQGRRIRCRTRLHTSEIDCIPGVKNVESEDGVIEILTSRAEPVVRELLHARRRSFGPRSHWRGPRRRISRPHHQEGGSMTATVQSVSQPP